MTLYQQPGGQTSRVEEILLKNLRSSFESLRTNGEAVEIMGDFSVHAERVEAFLGFFSRILEEAIESDF